jgi:hypothetical protein
MELILVHTLEQGQEKIRQASKRNVIVIRNTCLDYLKEALVFAGAPSDVVEIFQCEPPVYRECITTWLHSSNNQRGTCTYYRRVLHKMIR